MKGVAFPKRQGSSQPTTGGGASAEGQYGGAEAVIGHFTGTCVRGLEWRPLGLRLPAPRRATVSRDSMGLWGPITNDKGSFGD